MVRKRNTSPDSGTRFCPDTVKRHLRHTDARSVERSPWVKSSSRTRTQSQSGTRLRQSRIVLFQGTFEILNWGHVKAFERAKSHGDYLIVALNTNKLVRKFKGREPVLPWYQKRDIIKACRFVDKVVSAPDFSPLKLLKRYKVKVYVLTREWKDTKAREIAYMKKVGGRVVYSPRFKGVIPTSEIKRRLLKEAQNGGTK